MSRYPLFSLRRGYACLRRQASTLYITWTWMKNVEAQPRHSGCFRRVEAMPRRCVQ